jgi:hypothetical protein
MHTSGVAAHGRQLLLRLPLRRLALLLLEEYGRQLLLRLPLRRLAHLLLLPLRVSICQHTPTYVRQHMSAYANLLLPLRRRLAWQAASCVCGGRLRPHALVA